MVRGVVAVVGGLELVAVNDEVVLRAFLLLYAQFDGAIQAVALVEAALDELGGWVERVEHRGTVEQRLDVLAVISRLGAQLQRDGDDDLVPDLPAAGHGGVFASGDAIYSLAVHLDLRTFAPRGDADAEGDGALRRGRNGNRRGLLLRIVGFLCELQAGVGPVECGSCEQIDVQFVCPSPSGSRWNFRYFEWLSKASAATASADVAITIFLLRSRIHWVHVAVARREGRAGIEVTGLTSENMVENRALIIVHVGRFLFDKEQIASHLEHVVCRAGFRVALADIAGHSMCRPPSRLRQYHREHTYGRAQSMPQYPNGLEITRTSISIDIRVAHGRVFGVTDELWNVLVGVQVVEDIDTSTTVVNELVSVEKCGGLKKFATVLVLGDVVQIHQRIIHAAVFTTDVDVPHLLQLGFGAFAQTRIGPMSDAFSQVERVGITGKLVSGNQTGKNLVLRVPRCPNLAIGSIFLQCLELPLAIGA